MAISKKSTKSTRQSSKKSYFLVKGRRHYIKEKKHYYFPKKKRYFTKEGKIDKRIRNPERDLAKALTDLNKIFTTKELAKKFGIKTWQVSRYKKYRKRKPFDKRKREQILKFYKDIIERKKGLDYKYGYRIIRGRVQPILDYDIIKVKELVDEIGVEKLAKKIGVSPYTIRRWMTGGLLRFTNEARKKIDRLHQKTFLKLAGIFFLSQGFEIAGGEELAHYKYIHYQENFKGSQDEFLNYIHSSERGFPDIIDFLIAQKGKFGKEKAKQFLRHLGRVSSAHKEKSYQNCRLFVKHNFKGTTQSQLLKLIRKYRRK